LTDSIARYTLDFMAKVLTAIRIKEEHLTALAKIAEREDIPVSQLVRKAIVEFLDRQPKPSKK
jgi:predicted transcriptional regulator